MKLSENSTRLLPSIQVFNKKRSQGLIDELKRYNAKYSNRQSEGTVKAYSDSGPFYDFLSEIKSESLDNERFSPDDFVSYGYERVIESFNEIKKDSHYSFSEDYKKLLKKQSKVNFTIPEKRVHDGFKAGMIDLISNSIVKTQGGWINQDGDFILEEDATFEEVFSYANELSNLIPSFTIRDLEKIEDKGELIIDDEIIARKDREGNWITYSDNFGGRSLVKFNSGDVVRLLAHSDIEVAIYGFEQNKKLYHGNVTNSTKPEKEHILRKNSSTQGDAAYLTGSISEAVKVYANYKSYEISGKLLNEQDKGLIDKKDFVFGHIYECSTSAACFSASMKGEYVNILATPSLSAFVAMAKSVGESEVFFANQWLRSKNGHSTFDVYEAINRVNTVSPKNNILVKMFSAMGFEGVDITFPEKDFVNTIKECLKEIDKLDNSYFDGTGVSKSVVSDDFMTHLQDVLDSVPAKAAVGHNITFDPAHIVKEHIKLLPINNNSYTDQLDIYKQDGVELTIEDIRNLKSPDFDDIRNYWLQNEAKKESIIVFSEP